MKKTKIEWCDSTWNPVTGCLHGCEYCYAKRIAERFKFKKFTCAKEYTDTVHDLTEAGTDTHGNRSPYPYGFAPTLHRYRLNVPSNWTKPKNMFVCSMADLFGDWVPDEWIEEVFAACEKAPWHNYLFLTKNPGRYCKLDDAGKLPHKKNWWYGSSWTKPFDCVWDGGCGAIKDSFNSFLSVEPLLETMEPQQGIGCFNWVIIGAESGNRKERVTPKKEWIEYICKLADISQTPVFMKDSLLPIMGEENMRRELPEGLKRAKEAGGA